MYAIDGDKLTARPEVRLGDKIYQIDNRLSTFERINRRLKEQDGKSESDFAIILCEALGEAAFTAICEMDLSYAVMQELVMIVLAAIQDLTVEEARCRFRKTGG